MSSPFKPDVLPTEERDIGEAYSSSTSGRLTALFIPRLSQPSSPVVPQLNSPSSPDLSKRPSHVARALSRSQTLPRALQLEDRRPQRRNSKVDDLVVNPESIAKIRRWILGLVIVDFDVDHGPLINGVVPPLELSQAEAENIAFSAFPDSSQFEEGSEVHSFRMREDVISVPGVKRPVNEDGFIYGYVHFDQRKDAKSKRGYQQRSIIILTHHQYPALFSSFSLILGPLFQAHGVPMLEAACQNIVNWSDPIPGTTIELGFLGSVVHVELPRSGDDQQLTETTSFHEKYDPMLHILASSAPLTPPPVDLFAASLDHLWSVWECLVLCEPILVFGPSPAMTSQAVWWLRDLLRPIPFSGDIRPYFTIHDRDRSSIVHSKRIPKPGLLLGVTNPVFEQSCKQWPHTLSIGRQSKVKSSSKNVDMTLPGPAPGWQTKTHKRYISKDRALLKDLTNVLHSNHRNKVTLSLELRRHFCSRSSAVLVPLNRYLNTLIPPPAQASTRRLKAFNNREFFASLKAYGSPLPFRSAAKRKEFYERWLRTPAFYSWLAGQEAIVQRVLEESSERITEQIS